MDRLRIDKWLWAARFFKTRSLASKACELGRIALNGQPAKPAKDVRAGDMVKVKNDTGDFDVEVLLLSEMRGPAAVAQTLYRETEASRELRAANGGGAEGDAALRGDAGREAFEAGPPGSGAAAGPGLGGGVGSRERDRRCWSCARWNVIADGAKCLLRGKRAISKSAAKALAARFGVSVNLFL